MLSKKDQVTHAIVYPRKNIDPKICWIPFCNNPSINKQGKTRKYCSTECTNRYYPSHKTIIYYRQCINGTCGKQFITRWFYKRHCCRLCEVTYKKMLLETKLEKIRGQAQYSTRKIQQMPPEKVVRMMNRWSNGEIEISNSFSI